MVVVYATADIHQGGYRFDMMFRWIVRVPIYNNVIRHWTNGRNIILPIILTMGEPPVANRVLNMLHW